VMLCVVLSVANHLESSVFNLSGGTEDRGTSIVDSRIVVLRRTDLLAFKIGRDPSFQKISSRNFNSNGN